MRVPLRKSSLSCLSSSTALEQLKIRTLFPHATKDIVWQVTASKRDKAGKLILQGQGFYPPIIYKVSIMKYKVVLLVLMVASPSWTDPIVCEEEDRCGGPRKEEEVPLLVQDDADGVSAPLDVCVLPNDFAGKATLVEDCKTLDSGGSADISE